MQNRSQQIDDFLARSGWRGARRAPLAGDASFRRYERVTLAAKQAVLMDAPPQKEDIRPFIRIGEYLAGQGLSAPKIYARDEAQGFLLLEDLGDDLFTAILRKNPQQEETLYLAATDVLVDLLRQARRNDYDGYPAYDDDRMLKEAELFTQWFLPAAMGETPAPDHAAQFRELWSALLRALPPLPKVLVLRDYHADNLLWLPDRKGNESVGLLDFQDGVIGSPAYDMVSFLEDARRDVSARTVGRVMEHFLAQTSLPREEFLAAYALLGAQRNCKIIGIFVRLCVRDGKANYLSYLPRVWGHLERDLSHPLLGPLKNWMDAIVLPQWRGVLNIGKPQASA